MNANASDANSSIGSEYQQPRIERGRFRRASIEAMDVEREADRLYRVTHDGESYHADVENGGCTCPDSRYRGETYFCKHVIRASLCAVYAGGVRSKLIARVVRFANANGCPAHSSGCNGPVNPADSVSIPCPECCQSVRTGGVDEFTIWAAVNGQRGR